jgi:Putative MetA-pathway of phenol degradation
MSRLWVLIVLLQLALAGSAFAQSPCPTAYQTATSTRSSDLVCTVPQVYGPGGLVGTGFGGPLFPTAFHNAHFQATSISSLVPINAEIGVQLSQLPLASPVAGFIFANGVLQEAYSFGPVLTDRAETIGKRRIFVGLSYQYFEFDKADDVNLKNFGAVYLHQTGLSSLCTGPFAPPCFTEPDGTREPIYTQDIVATLNRIDVKVNQVTIVGTYGILHNLDVSVAIPLIDVRMTMDSSANIISFEAPSTAPGCTTATTDCIEHYFISPAPANIPGETYHSSSSASFVNSNSAFGIGDFRIRGKYVPWRSAKEKSAVAVGLDLRLPTGDAYNFLGSGTYGVRPFATYSYSARVSPHASFAFEKNGSSVLAGNVTGTATSTAATTAPLPNVVSYSGGADGSVTHWLGVSADYIGTSLLNEPRFRTSAYTDAAGTNYPTITAFTSTANQASISLGAKVRPLAKLLVTGNVLFRLNDAGLHFKPSPLVGVSYTF